jgi:hypothetical protein
LAAEGWPALLARSSSSSSSGSGGGGGLSGGAFGPGLYLSEASSDADRRAGAADGAALYCGPCALGDGALFGRHGAAATEPPSLAVPLAAAASTDGGAGGLEWRTRGESDFSGRGSDASDADVVAAGSSVASPASSSSAAAAAVAATRALRPPGMFEARAGSFALVVCRASLGCPLVVPASRARGDPAACAKAAASGKHDAVVGAGGRGAQGPRTFVVLDPAQVYPEYVVIYDRVYDWL